MYDATILLTTKPSPKGPPDTINVVLPTQQEAGFYILQVPLIAGPPRPPQAQEAIGSRGSAIHRCPRQRYASPKVVEIGKSLAQAVVAAAA